MILRVLRLLASLSLRQYMVILITIILPAIFLPILAPSIPGGPVVLPIVYFVWSVVAVLSVASMLKDDRSKAAQSVDRKLENLSREVQLLKDEHLRRTAGLQDQVNEIDRVVRSGFEGLGVVLSPRRSSLRANISAGVPRMSATLTVDSPNRIVRFRRWVQRHALRFWRWFYG